MIELSDKAPEHIKRWWEIMKKNNKECIRTAVSIDKKMDKQDVLKCLM